MCSKSVLHTLNKKIFKKKQKKLLQSLESSKSRRIFASSKTNKYINNKKNSIMTRFNSVFSLSNIAATLTDGKIYADRSWSVNGVTPSNYMMCYRTLDAAIEFAGIELDSNFSANYTPAQIQNMCEEYFSQVTGDNVESYESEARKEIWKHFLKTGNVLRAVIKDVNCEVTIYLYKNHQPVFMIKNGKKLEL